MNALQKEVSKLAKLAGKYALKHSEGLRVSSKEGDPRNLVTNIDIEVSDILKKRVLKRHPQDIFYSEEDTTNITSGKRVWSIDPIDGTSNYARSIPYYSSCVSVIEDGEVLATSIYAPVLNEHFTLTTEGPKLNDKVISVGQMTELKEAYVNFHPGRKDKYREWAGETKVALLKTAKKSTNLASSALDICYVACGRFDVLVYGTLSTIDVAGAIAILRAAGGEVYNYETKKPVTFSPEPQRIIATATPELLEDYFDKIA